MLPGIKGKTGRIFPNFPDELSMKMKIANIGAGSYLDCWWDLELVCILKDEKTNYNNDLL